MLEIGIGTGRVALPLLAHGIAVTGVAIGASIYDTIVLLGASRTRMRLDRAIEGITDQVV